MVRAAHGPNDSGSVSGAEAAEAMIFLGENRDISLVPFSLAYRKILCKFCFLAEQKMMMMTAALLVGEIAHSVCRRRRSPKAQAAASMHRFPRDCRSIGVLIVPCSCSSLSLLQSLAILIKSSE